MPWNGGSAQVPDVPVIFPDGAVGGEVTGPGDVHQHLPAPRLPVLVVPEALLFHPDIVLQVQQGHEVVLGEEVLVHPDQALGLPDLQHPGAEDEVHQGLQLRLLPVVAATVAVLLIEPDDLVGGAAEDVEVLLPHQPGDLHVGTVHGTQSHGAVGHEFHIAGAAGLLGGQRDLLGDVTGGDQHLGGGDVVVLHHDQLQPWGDLGVLLHKALQAEKQVDGVLGQGVGRGCLGAEDDGQRPGRQAARLDLAVLPNGVQGVQADGVFLEYLYGRTLDELLDERLDCADHSGFQDLVDEYYKAVSWRDNFPVADYDLIFGNIMVDGDNWTILDYEWTFDQPYSGRATTLRSLYYYMMGAGKRREWSLSYMKERLGCSDADIQKIAAQEVQFQKKVTGNRLSMQQMRDRIGCAVLRVTELEAKQAGSWSRKKVQIYTDCGEGFSEETSYFVPGAYVGEADCSNENKIAFEIELDADVMAVRIDPALESCLLTVQKLELERESGSVRKIAFNDCILNGNLISKNAAIFATQDPNLTIDLSTIKGNDGMCILRAEFGIVSLPESRAAEVENGLKNNGAAKNGAEKKTLFGGRKPGRKG